jgi:hypothetical protein
LDIIEASFPRADQPDDSKPLPSIGWVRDAEVDTDAISSQSRMWGQDFILPPAF